MSAKQKLKKRVTITISPGLYNRAKKRKKPFSQTVEEAMEYFFHLHTTESIRANLEAKAFDEEWKQEQLEITKDFRYADAENIPEY